MGTPVSVNGWPAFTTWAANPNLGWLIVTLPNGQQWKIYTLNSLKSLWANFILDYNQTVMPLSRLVESFDPRKINGSVLWSNHSSATAVDLCTADLPQHEYEMNGTQRAAMNRLMAWYSPVLEWGGNWSHDYLDEMHTQIRQSPAGDGTRVISQAQVNAVVAKGRYYKPPKPPTPVLQEELMARIVSGKKAGYVAANWYVYEDKDPNTGLSVTKLEWLRTSTMQHQKQAAGVQVGTIDVATLNSLPITGPTPPAG